MELNDLVAEILLLLKNEKPAGDTVNNNTLFGTLC